MASTPPPASNVEFATEDSPYRPPPPKSVDEIMKSDAADESLVKYKQSLLGSQPNVVVFEDDPRTVIIRKLGIITEEHPEIELDLTGDASKFKKHPIVIKEGVRYRVKFYFYVQRDIVTGLRYVHQIGKGIMSEKETHMMGSYGPKSEIQVCQTPWDEAPEGLLARGSYSVKSKFVDDDKKEYASFEWTIEIKKNWKD